MDRATAKQLYIKASEEIPNSEEDSNVKVFLLPRQNVATDSNDIVYSDVKLLPGSPDGSETKVIMIVGETGSGKTTLINGMVNHVLGSEFTDDSRFKIISEPTEDDQTESQTQQVNTYLLYHEPTFRTPYSLQVIDTPGFADSSGIEKDERITNQIQALFGSDKVKHVDCIGFVVKSNQNRLTPAQKYIYNCLLSLFGKDVKDNIVLLLTFAEADNKKPQALGSVKKANIPLNVFFKFNNSGIYGGNDGSNLLMEPYWNMGFKSFEDFFKKIDGFVPKTLELSAEVLEERAKLSEAVDDILADIRNGLADADVIEQRKVALVSHTDDIEAKRNFSFSITREHGVKVPIPEGQYITNCLQCKYSCHPVCYIKESANKAGCWAMDGEGNCRICFQKCAWDVHRNNDYRWEYNIETTTQSFDDLNISNSNDLMIACDDEYQTNLDEVIAKVSQARLYINRIKEIALKPDPMNEGEYVKTLIAAEEQNKDQGWENRVAHLKKVQERMKALGKMLTEIK